MVGASTSGQQLHATGGRTWTVLLLHVRPLNAAKVLGAELNAVPAVRFEAIHHHHPALILFISSLASSSSSNSNNSSLRQEDADSRYTALTHAAFMLRRSRWATEPKPPDIWMGEPLTE